MTVKGKRVLLVNKFYYNRGGAEVVTLTLREALERAGAEVGVFTMSYHSNECRERVWSAPEVSFKTGGLTGKMRFARRVLGLDDTARRFGTVLDTFRPEVVHLHNIHSYLSPTVARVAAERGLRVVWTLHDYKPACPAYACLNRGVPCERCITNPYAVLTQRCFKNSHAAGALAWLEARRWSLQRLQRWTDAFVCPSDFLRGMMLKAGISPEKLHVINNFIDPVKLDALQAGEVSAADRGDTLLYVGRLSREKGVTTLLETVSRMPDYHLRVAGNGPERAALRERFARVPNITFLGQLSAVDVARELQRARAIVVPSECYENNPLTVIEALCAGTPVVGARIGGIPELIDEGHNGLTFTSGDSADLEKALRGVMSDAFHADAATVAAEARRRFSSENHLSRLIPLYFPRR